MSSPNSISVQKLSRLVGTPKCPIIVDVRTDEDFDSDPRLVPGSVRRGFADAPRWANDLGDRATVVVCNKGQKLSQGTAAWLRQAGLVADTLEEGFVGWAGAGLPLVPTERIPRRDELGRTIWVTRSRPKVDRIACPWLIRRFVDPGAVFLFVAPSEVAGVAEKFDATPFDVEGVFWSHRGGLCTFDAMVQDFGLATEPLQRLAAIVRGADTALLDLVPQAAGLLAASLGLSRMFADDLRQLDAGMTLYDAFYLWCRDAVDEAHDWPSAKPGKSA